MLRLVQQKLKVIQLATMMALISSAAIANDPAQLSGTVEAEGAPLAGALVVVTSFEAPLGQFQTLTAADGSWSLSVPMTDLAERRIYLEAGSTSYAPARFGGEPDLPGYFGFEGTGAITLTPGLILFDLSIELPPGGRLSGSVLARADDTALPGSTVRPVAAEGPLGLSFGPQFFGTSDAEGNWQSALALPAGEYHLLAWPPAGRNLVVTSLNDGICQRQSCAIRSTDTVQLATDEHLTGIDFRLPPGAVLAGELAPSGIFRTLRLHDASGGLVATSGISAAASSNAWLFDGLAGGSYYLEARGPGFSFWVPQLHNGLPCPPTYCDVVSGPPLTVSPGSFQGDINIELAQGGRAAGSLVDAFSGLPPPTSPGDTSSLGDYLLLDISDRIAGVGNIVAGDDAILLQASTAVPPGHYRLASFNRGLGAGIGYNQPDFFLNFTTAPGYSDALYPDAVCAGLICDETAASLVEVTEAVITEGLELLVRRGSMIRGRIVDETTDSGIAGAVAVLVDENNRRYAAARTNQTGHFEFGGFPAGTYYLRTAMSTLFGDNGLPDRNAYFDTVWGSPSPCSELLCDPDFGTALVLDGNNHVDDIVLQVQPGPVIRGFAIDPLTRTSINRGWVEVYDESDRLVGKYHLHFIDRLYQTTALAPGTYRLVAVLSPAFAPVPIPPPAPFQSRSAARSAELFVTIGKDDVETNFLAIDQAAERIFRDRFDQP